MKLQPTFRKDLVCLAAGVLLSMPTAWAQSAFSYRVPIVANKTPLPSTPAAPEAPQTPEPPAPGKSVLSIQSLDFGAIGVGSTAQGRTVAVTNAGGSPVSITAVDAGSSAFSASAACGSLAPGSTCDILVGFQPQARGVFSQQLTVQASDGTQAVALHGEGVVGELATSAPAMAFGLQQQFTSSSAKEVTLRNSGPVNLRIYGISVTPTDAGFQQTNNCGPLSPGEACAVSVTYAPTATGVATAAVLVGHDGDGEMGVTLSGEARAASATLSAGSVPATPVGGSSAVLATVTNTGIGPVTLGTAAVSGTGFSVQNSSCGTSLPASASCTVTLTFSPSSTATHAATLTLPTGAGSKTASLSQTGALGALALSTASTAYGSATVGTSTATRAISVTNTGTWPVSIASASFTTGSANFKSSHNCSTLAVGDSCTVTTWMTPATAGALTGVLTVTPDSPATSVSMAASGNGNPVPVNSFSTSTGSLAWGTQYVGAGLTRSVTVTNTGNTSLALASAIAAGGSDFSATSNCASLAAGASCTVTTTFTPATTGARYGTLSISGSGVTTQNVSLSGTGAPVPVSSFSTSTTSLAWGTQYVGAGLTRSVTVTNTGNTPLALASTIAAGGSDFSATSNCASLAAGANCTVTTTFTPAATGARYGTLSISGSGVTAQNVSLSGTGAPVPVSSFSTSTTSLAWGTQYVGAGSASYVTVTNTGNTSLALSASITAGASDFSASSNCSSLAAGASCTVTTSFVPAATGARYGTLSISGSGITARTVSLSGTGAPVPVSSFSINPTSLAWGAQNLGAGASANVTVTNTGNTTLTMSSAISAGGSDFSASSGCGTLAAGASCTVTATFKPAAAGARYGTLSVSASGLTAKTVALSGTGVSPALASFSPGNGSTLNVRLHDGDSQYDEIIGYATVQNVGGTNMSVSWSTTASHLYSISGCPSTLTPGQSCTLSVRFTRGWGGGTEGMQVWPMYVNTSGGNATFTIRGEYLWN